MKAKKALGMALALASALFFFACSNMDSGSVDNGAAYLYSAQRSLSVNVEGVELSDGSGEAVYDPWINRTVLPATAYTTSELTLVLRAISNGKTESFTLLTNPTVVSGGTPHDGQFTYDAVELDAASYDFWCYAYVTNSLSGLTLTGDPAADAETIYKASEVYTGVPSTAAVTTAFWAHGSADLTNGNGEVTFKLTPFDLKGYGNVKVGGGYIDKDNSVKALKIGIYNIYTNEVIEQKDGSDAEVPLNTSGTVAAPYLRYFGATASVTGTMTPTTATKPEDVTGAEVASTDAASFDVPAGSYRIAVTFYKDTAAKPEDEIGYWSDLVIVEPDNTSEILNIFFNGIKSIPAAPTQLTASLVKGSFEAGKPTYDVILDWKDNAQNEKGFLVRVSTYTVNFTGGSQTRAVAADGIYGFTAAKVPSASGLINVTSLLGSEYYTQTNTSETNLLLSQCKAVKLTLKTGYLYDFEVCAYNAIGASRYTDTDAATDGYADTAEVKTDLSMTGDFDGWTPRAKKTDKSTPADIGSDAFAARAAGLDWAGEETMVYRMKTPATKADATYTKITPKPQATDHLTAGTDYYVSDGGSGYKIAYISEFDGTSDYYTITAGGTPYTPYHVNLYSIRFDLEDGLYYTGGTNVSRGSIYNFYRFGNDTPSFNTAFGTIAATALSATSPLKNPIITTGAAAPSTTDAKSNATPFVIKWNTAMTAYYNWTTWYRQSSTANGSTMDYTGVSGAPIPADPQLLTANNHAYGNQVVYAAYSGSTSKLTVYVTINTAGDGTYDIKDSYIKAVVSDTEGSSTGTDLTVTQGFVNTVDVSSTGGKPWLYLKLDSDSTTPTFEYSAVRYEINGKVQSATVNSQSGVCKIDLRKWSDYSPITVLVAGYYDGRWYSRSFSIAMTSND